jgi:hypothetical protein
MPGPNRVELDLFVYIEESVKAGYKNFCGSKFIHSTGKNSAFFHLLQKGKRMKFTRRSFWKFAGTGILAASIPKSAFSNAEVKIPDYSFIPLTDIADHMNPCFPDHAPGFIASRSYTRQT